MWCVTMLDTPLRRCSTLCPIYLVRYRFRPIDLGQRSALSTYIHQLGATLGQKVLASSAGFLIYEP